MLFPSKGAIFPSKVESFLSEFSLCVGRGICGWSHKSIVWDVGRACEELRVEEGGARRERKAPATRLALSITVYTRCGRRIRRAGCEDGNSSEGDGQVFDTSGAGHAAERCGSASEEVFARGAPATWIA